MNSGGIEVFRAVAEAGIPLGRFRSRNNESLLEVAIQRKRNDLIRFLFDAGATPSDGGPLVESAKIGSMELTRLLIEHGKLRVDGAGGFHDVAHGLAHAREALLPVAREDSRLFGHRRDFVHGLDQLFRGGGNFS